MRKLILPGLVALIVAGCTTQRQSAEIAVIPQPSRIIEGQGAVQIGPDNVKTAVDSSIANPEGYRLMARNGIVEIVGGSAAGVFSGLQPREQLKD
ncbi:MAG: glycoside hydrolase family 20 zincin-like fold domain-containing protein, partial [Rikenellaceae bacterium]|nr:glycoside hydrolase family 20 zincin-like fold domain-containing protein [Rikenellaceae bacterium]